MWHEYGAIPGARFEIAEPDGTWASIIGIARDARDAAKAAAAAGEPPTVFCIDTMTAMWEGLKNWTGHRAANSTAGRKALEVDPDAKVEVAPNYWNDANARHAELMTVLLTFPGIVIMIARGGEVTRFENGQPAKENKVTWSVQAQKGVPSAATAHLRLSNEARPLLVSKKGVFNPIRPGIDPPLRLADKWTLESVIFGTLGLNASAARVGGYTEMQPDLTPQQIRDEAVDPWTSVARIRELYTLAAQARYGMSLANEWGEDEPLPQLLSRIGGARAQARKDLDSTDLWLIAIGDMSSEADIEKMRAEIETSFATVPRSDPRLMGIREAFAVRCAEIAQAESVAQAESADARREADEAHAAAEATQASAA
jgi:hypothetical protein